MTAEAERALNQELLVHRRLARPGTFVDIGAHTGDFCLAIADVPGIDLVAVEPLAHALATLRARAAAANVRVHTVAAALSDRLGHLRLAAPVLAGTGPVWEWASIAKDFSALRATHPEIVGVRSKKVLVTTLDSLGLADVRGIKLDAEGAEYEVLRGGRELLRTQRPVVSVELEERHRAGCTYAVPAFMAALGYDCVFVAGGHTFPLAAFDRATMQRASPSPASHVYSDPYVNCFFFIPEEAAELREKLPMGR
jgi:FkbM family methyltransferase